MIDPATFLLLMALVLALTAWATRLITRRQRRPIADINPRTGERTDV